jgi:hypothetical protein
MGQDPFPSFHRFLIIKSSDFQLLWIEQNHQLESHSIMMDANVVISFIDRVILQIQPS